jgi:hypothetical protein
MFQDEGRFGLMGRPRRCWAPRHVRPVVGARLERQFTYAFAAVSPHDGVMDSLILPWVNAETMSLFLATVAERHADEFIVMVMDQAGWHIAGDLIVPANMRLVYLPPYSPELNPAEHLWESLRENHFGNIVSSSLDAVEATLTAGLCAMEADLLQTQKLTGFNWITSISLKAN